MTHISCILQFFLHFARKIELVFISSRTAKSWSWVIFYIEINGGLHISEQFLLLFFFFFFFLGGGVASIFLRRVGNTGRGSLGPFSEEWEGQFWMVWMLMSSTFGLEDRDFQ